MTTSNEHNNAPAVPQGWRDFLTELSKQKPEKPDYWSSCGQCERNSSTAEDLLDATPAPAPAQEVDDLDAMRGALAKRGLAIVPMLITRAMADVLGEEDWQWEDLLAHAEAITEPEYKLLLSLPDMLDAKPAQEVGLTDEEIYAAFVEVCDDGSAPPLDEFKQADGSIELMQFANNIIAAIRAKGGK